MVKSVLDKTKHSVESMITTLDPGMAPYISMYMREMGVGHCFCGVCQCHTLSVLSVPDSW